MKTLADVLEGFYDNVGASLKYKRDLEAHVRDLKKFASDYVLSDMPYHLWHEFEHNYQLEFVRLIKECPVGTVIKWWSPKNNRAFKHIECIHSFDWQEIGDKDSGSAVRVGKQFIEDLFSYPHYGEKIVKSFKVDLS